MKRALPIEQELKHLLRLLTSTNSTNVIVGVTLLEGLEVTETLIHQIDISTFFLHKQHRLISLALTWVEEFELVSLFMTEIFALYKCTRNKQLRKKALAFLEKHASPELKAKLPFKYLLRRANARSTNPSDATIKRNIIRYEENCEIDGIRLAHILYHKYGTGVHYLLTVPPKEERIEFLKKWIKGTTVSITGKKLSKFPVDLLEFPELTSIDLSNNAIEEIPDEIEQFQKLEVLKLNHNKLKSLNIKLLKL